MKEVVGRREQCGQQAGEVFFFFLGTNSQWSTSNWPLYTHGARESGLSQCLERRRSRTAAFEDPRLSASGIAADAPQAISPRKIRRWTQQARRNLLALWAGKFHRCETCSALSRGTLAKEPAAPANASEPADTVGGRISPLHTRQCSATWHKGWRGQISPGSAKRVIFSTVKGRCCVEYGHIQLFGTQTTLWRDGWRSGNKRQEELSWFSSPFNRSEKARVSCCVLHAQLGRALATPLVGLCLGCMEGTNPPELFE